MWYLNPRLSEGAMLQQYADDAYFEGSNGLNEGYSGYADQEKSLRPSFARMLQQLKSRNMTGGHLLEVGCGYGYLLDEARSYFDFRVGTDFSTGAVAQASTYADKVILGGLADLDEGAMFDCIIASEVLEHIYDPNAFMAEIYAHLNPGGWVLLAVPDMGSLWRKVLQKRWPSFKLPEHVTYYDRHSLKRLYTQSGFEACEVIPSGHAFPLPVLLEKLHLNFLPVPNMNIWLPGVVLGMVAQRPLGEQ